MDTRERLKFGVSVEGGPLSDEELCAVSATAGESLAYVLWFEDFHADAPIRGIESACRRGALPIVTWEPWSAPLRSIVDGEHDEYLVKWANELSVCGLPT